MVLPPAVNYPFLASAEQDKCNWTTVGLVHFYLVKCRVSDSMFLMKDISSCMKLKQIFSLVYSYIYKTDYKNIFMSMITSTIK